MIMVVRDIQEFSEIRTKARAYFCYLFNKNLPSELPDISEKSVTNRLRKIMGDLSDSEGVYLLDAKGIQVSATYTPGQKIDEDIGSIRSMRAYYYRAVKEQRCTITDPYPSLITRELTVTASHPILDEDGEVIYVACIDMPLKAVIKFAHPTSTDSLFGRLNKFAYTLFSISLAMVSLLLFVKGVEHFLAHGLNYRALDIKEIFEATILITLSLAIYDLVKTLFEEEVMGKFHQEKGSHRTMIKFLGSIIIALSIEALMLVFKFAISEPEKIIHAIVIVGAVSVLLLALAVYIKFTKSAKDHS
jgi:hypothetical protein